eukprot:765322-Hanusia_phi.AAC.4
MGMGMWVAGRRSAPSLALLSWSRGAGGGERDWGIRNITCQAGLGSTRPRRLLDDERKTRQQSWWREREVVLLEDTV